MKPKIVKAEKPRIVKAEVFRSHPIRAYLFDRQVPFIGAQGFIVICPHNWIVTARPPKAKASKKGAKRK